MDLELHHPLSDLRKTIGDAGLGHGWMVGDGTQCRPTQSTGEVTYGEAGGQCLASGKVSFI